MKIKIETTHEEPLNELYWAKVQMYADDESKSSQILVLASMEYLSDLYHLNSLENVNKDIFSTWIKENVLKKWEQLGDSIFEQDVHYDVYANSQEGESRGLEFLIKEVK